jgi:enoyl-CoA hydratase
LPIRSRDCADAKPGGFCHNRAIDDIGRRHQQSLGAFAAMLDQPLTSKMIAEKDGAIGRLIFNNPARHNAVSLEMWEAVAQIVEDFERDDNVRVIVVSGAGGRAFVSGADISEFKERRASEEAAAAYARISEGARLRLQETLKPTIAMISGYCIGGGVGTALACDMRIAAEGSKFGIPAAKLGLGYAYDGIKKLVDLVGPAHAREIFFTARQFTAEEALAMGLVNRVVPAAKLESYVNDYCAMIAQNAPLTVRAAKVAIREALKDESKRDLDLCKRLVDECFASADYTEGRTAFMEKRQPVFTGR